MPEKFRNVVLERDGKQLVQSCDKMKMYRKCEARILHKIKRWKAKWIIHILHRNCHIKHVVEGKIEGTRSRGIRRKQLLNDFMEKKRHWNFKEKSLTLAGGVATGEEAMKLAEDRLHNECFVRSFSPFLCCSPLQETMHKGS